MKRSLLGLLPALALLVGAVPTQAAAATFTTTVVKLHVVVGPDGAKQDCNVDLDLLVPATATAAHPAPAVVSTNGYLGSKSQAGPNGAPGSIAAMFAKQGYVAVSYSGLGWAGSSCAIELDSPAFDGQAAAQVIDFLGGDTSKAFTAFAKPATWTGPHPAKPPVLLDRAGDPRVGMIGTSYGAGAEFAAAATTPKLDTIITQATWGDLSYSLAPNNLGDGRSIVQSAAPPGVAKTEWVAQLAAGGPSQVASGSGGGAVTTCPGFDVRVCSALLGTIALGYPDAASLALLHDSSPAQYARKVRIPTFLLQGEKDSLFNLHEAAGTYLRLRAQGTPAKLLWQSWGHSDQTPAPGEEDSTALPSTHFLDREYLAWMDHYLRHSSVSTGPAFQYYRDWIRYSGSGPNDEQYGASPSYPLATTRYHLSGTSDLVAGTPVPGGSSFTTSPVIATSYSETSGQSLPDAALVRDAPGTYVGFTSVPLARAVDVVGAGTLTVSLSAPAFVGAPVAGRLVLFAKLYDVAPDGTAVLPDRLVSPVRVVDVTKPVTITLPAVVHRFAAGHRLRLVLAQGDAGYRGNLTSASVKVLAPGTLDLPVATARLQRSATPVTHPPRAAGSLAATGLPDELALLGVTLLLVVALAFPRNYSRF